MPFSSHEKNYLALLAIPVILSMVLGLSLNDTPDAQAFTGSAQSFDDVRDSEESTESKERDRIKQLRTCIEACDFAGFLEAARNTPFADIMTEEAFRELKAQYDLTMSGYHQTSPSDFE